MPTHTGDYPKWRGRSWTRSPEGDRARLWLFGVVRNLLRRGAQRRRGDAALVQRLATVLAAAQAAVSPPDDHARRALAAGMAQLTERDREILALTAWEDLRPAEIAAVVGISPNAVRIRLHRARTRLARRLGSRDPLRRCTPVASE